MKPCIYQEYGVERIKVYPLKGVLNLTPPIRVQNYHLILIEEGYINLDLNFRLFKMRKHSSIHISAGDIIRGTSVSNDICGYHIIFSQEFQTEMRTTRKSPISIQLKKEFPYQEFSEDEYALLEGYMERIIKFINDKKHFYQSIVIKNEVQNLLLNISNKRKAVHGNHIDNADHHGMIRERFRNLIAGHSDRQHNVSWYAEAMMISPDYLSKIIREYDGTSASAWISDSIIEKCEFLMKQSNLSLKEISDRMNFTDQSTFGRFFKSKTGLSPKAYRKMMAECSEESIGECSEDSMTESLKDNIGKSSKENIGKS